MINIKLVLDNDIWNCLTVCKQKITYLKTVTYKLFTEKS